MIKFDKKKKNQDFQSPACFLGLYIQLITYNLCMYVVCRYINITMYSYFRNQTFMLDEMSLQNASRFAIFLKYKNMCSSFFNSFHAILSFNPPINAQEPYVNFNPN